VPSLHVTVLALAPTVSASSSIGSSAFAPCIPFFKASSLKPHAACPLEADSDTTYRMDIDSDTTYRMDIDSLKDAQSGLGTGAVIVMDKLTDIVMAITRFLKLVTLLFYLLPFFLTCVHSFTNTSCAASACLAEREPHG